MVSALIKSNAKLNLSLNIVSKKKKFHEIQSLFCFIDLYDKIFISETNQKKHQVSFSGLFSRAIKRDNSISKLLKILDKESLLKKKYKINVVKFIPQKSGLGGGSMNAASILNFLIEKKIINLKNEIKFNICDKIGHDTKIGLFKNLVFLNKNRLVTNIKKKLNFYVFVFKPNFSCSTKTIYSKVKNFSKPYKSLNKLLLNISNSNNDLEEIVLKKNPGVKRALVFLKNIKGVEFVRMTGSGSCFVAYFKNKKRMEYASKLFTNKYKKYWSVMSKTI